MRISVLLLFCCSIIFVSCSPYQKVYSGDDTGAKYVFADSLYKIGKYKKSLKLMEQVVPAYRGKPQAERLMFMYSNTFYELGDFYLAGYQFERFETTYPKSDSVEVAAYRSAKSYYELSPKYSLDQKDTEKALEKLQSYINNYPDTPYREETNALVAELRGKLERKDIEVAKQYLRISDYKPAIAAFDNFITDHPGSEFRKDAFFGRMDAQYQLAINSVPTLVEERLIEAKGYYNGFVKYYKDSDLKEDADKILNDINKRLNKKEPTS
ncbi:outer membrane protein assembly factor BamD [Ulvibacter antarcticus]|uniref:Beta-barrel assembly machine subunit BamD n=1 Tax=Ulvibacter antarcticus TaxID=442714 RepID=A0A3L9Z3M2_9FLAO|nr:outer membrane protein assembly factor BamD [Ulvibacter antarcticus]RMA64905.1 Beta-barrel assembly machine subunit BamD [Ulvibacter antarcticus]